MGSEFVLDSPRKKEESYERVGIRSSIKNFFKRMINGSDTKQANDARRVTFSDQKIYEPTRLTMKENRMSRGGNSPLKGIIKM